MQVSALSLSYGGQHLFEDVTFGIQKGERCGLVGRNGSGKSTLLRLIAGLEKPDSGTMVFPKNYKIGFLEQQLRFTKPTVLEEAALGLGSPDEVYKAEKILFGLGFSEEMLENSPDELSGGYRLRVQLAKVLLSEPDCLLLDEPTNYLDILSIRFLSKFLQSWQGEMILISHDLQFLDAVTTHMMGIQRQKVVKIKGKSADLFHLIAEAEERHETTRKTLEKKKAHLQSFVERFGAKATKAGQAQARVKMIEKLPDLEKLKALRNLDFSFLEAPFPGKKMLEASHVSFSYSGKEDLIEDFSLVIEKGDRIAIIGKNGYGKSTLLRLLAEQLKPGRGTVTGPQSKAIGYFGQTSIERLDPKMRIEEEIASANPNLNFTQVRSICGLMMFSGDLAEKPVSVLSGGEKSRVLLGKIIARPCNLLLLDEPTHHLDIESIEALIDAIEEFFGAAVIVTHSEWVLRRIPFNKLIVCHKQRQDLFLGGYDEFLETEGWIEEKPEPKKKKQPPPKSTNRDSEIKACENKILKLEESLLKLHSQMDELVQAGRYEEIKPIQEAIAQAEAKMDDLYHLLSELFNDN